MSLFTSFAVAKWLIFDWHLTAEVRSHKRSATAAPELRIAKLRELLRRSPSWSSGHQRLALESLSINQIDSAFISAQAVLQLEGRGRAVRVARTVLARCYLKRGAPAEARKLINALLADDSMAWDLREDLAAICIQEGEFASAVSELEQIPQDQLSAEGHAALQFARSKAAP